MVARRALFACADHGTLSEVQLLQLVGIVGKLGFFVFLYFFEFFCSFVLGWHITFDNDGIHYRSHFGSRYKFVVSCFNAGLNY